MKKVCLFVCVYHMENVVKDVQSMFLLTVNLDTSLIAYLINLIKLACRLKISC